MKTVVFLLVSLILRSRCCNYSLSEDVEMFSPVLNNIGGLLRLIALPERANIIFIGDTEDLHDNIRYTTEMFGYTVMRSNVRQFDTFLVALMTDVLNTGRAKTYTRVLNFIVFCKATNVSYILKTAQTADTEHGMQGLLRHFSKWVFIVEHNSSEVYLDSLRSTNLDNVAVLSKRRNTRPKKTARCIVLQTLLWKTKSREFSHVGNICNERYSTFDTPLFPNRNLGLNGRHLRLGVLGWIHYCKKLSTNNTRLALYSHVCKEIADGLSQALNFSYEFVEGEDKTWGGRLANSTWTGLLGLVVRKEVDFLIIPFASTEDRLPVIDFSSLIMSVRVQCLYKRIEGQTESWFPLLSCFKFEVYLCGMIALIWSAGLFAVLKNVNGFLRLGKSSELCSDLADSAGAVFLVPLHQGRPVMSINSSGQIFYAFWWLFCIIIIAVYTGNLVAFITVVREKIPFRTLKELAEDNVYTVLIERDSGIENPFKYSNDSYMKVLWRKVSQGRSFEVNSSAEDHEIIKRMLQEGKSVYIDAEVVLDVINNGQMRKMATDIQEMMMSLPFPKRSPLLEIVSEKLTTMYETGSINGLMKKWITKEDLTQFDQKDKKVQLHVSDLLSAFVACGVTLFVAVITLCTEYYWQTRIRTTKVQIQNP